MSAKSQPPFDVSRTAVYLAYLDDSGSDKECPIVLVGAILVNDELFSNLEAAAAIIAELLMPAERLSKFEEFHAVDLFQGNGIFKDIDETERKKALTALIKYANYRHLPFIYSAIEKKELISRAYGGVNPLDLAFRMCALGVERWIGAVTPKGLCLMVMDETKEAGLKHAFKEGFRNLRGKGMRPPYSIPKRLLHIHDDLYFGDSRDSVGIQIADLYSYFVARKLKGYKDADEFYDLFRQDIICANVEPEWTQLKEIWVQHDDSDI